LHLRAVLRVAENLFSGNYARFENLLVVVNVVNEGVERAHALLQAGLEPNPFFQRQDAGHDVEGDEALGAFVLTVHGEGDADAMEEGVGLGALLCQSFGGLMGEPLGVAQVVRAGGAIGQGHFVIRFIAQNAVLLAPASRV